MELWKPAIGDTVEGIFVGFSDWPFQQGVTDWLLTLKTDDGGFVALPKWHSIKSCYLANREFFIPKESIIRVTFTKEQAFEEGDSRAPMRIAKIELKEGNDWTELFERRIITDGEKIAGLLAEGEGAAA